MAFTADNCNRISIRTWRLRATEGDDRHDGESRTIVSEEWTPRSRVEREFPDVPPHIASAATEAIVCLSARAYRAVRLTPSSRYRGDSQGPGCSRFEPEKRIDSLHEPDEIRRQTKERAHEVRHFGSDMAHGDFIDSVTRGEAEEVIELMAEVLDAVYQSPARLARREEAREAKKPSGQA